MSALNILVLFVLMSCSKSSVEDPGNNKSDDDSIIVNPLNGYEKMWEDDFEAEAINTDYWTVGSLRDANTGDLVPGAKGDHLLNDDYAGYITNEDVYLEDGALVLRNQKRNYIGANPNGNYDYTSGWIMSMHKVYLNKGYIEIKAKFPSGKKVWPALWLIAEDLIWGPEWDMFEYFGQKDDKSDIMGTHLAVGSWPDIEWHTSWINYFDIQYNCEEWHVYGFEWTETEANFFIDGDKVNTIKASDVSNWPNEDMYLVLNNGVSTKSSEGNTIWPNYLKIDYIEIYKKLQL